MAGKLKMEQTCYNRSSKISCRLELRGNFSTFKQNFETEIISYSNFCSLDNLLDGGLYPGELYEFCGLSSAGKTQLCHTIAVNVILETDGVVRYFDTKRDFSASRIQMILDARKLGDEVKYF